MKNINVAVSTNASKNHIEVISGPLQNELYLRVWVTAVPEKDKANKVVVDMVAKHIKIAPSLLVIKRGQRGRKKLFKILD